ncbi:hypothetical protein AB4Z14_19800 [Terrabacter sp. 2TAF16]|jgi:hypothetical protein|uniref:hypothetical protein n=1 Tax=Terrabacter sp. 2TAF16 TaxID=3233008 RepID=UPI003F9AD2B5
MAEVTLGDYTGYILLEMIRAREMADHYSRTVAERYAADEVMRHFAVPRFKVPKMELTIPVLISGARFSQVLRFDMAADDFVATMGQRAAEARERLASPPLPGFPGKIGPVMPGRPDIPILLPPRPVPVDRDATVGAAVTDTGDPTATPDLRSLALDFHAQLVANPDPLRPETIVAVMWSRIFWSAVGDPTSSPTAPPESALPTDPRQALLAETSQDVLELVRSRTVIDRTTIDNLLINPETNVVKNGSTDSSVFTVSAELLEEAFFLRSVTDESGATSTVVEFE